VPADVTRSVGTLASLRVRAVTLEVAKGPDLGRSARIDQPTFVVGGGDSADFRLTDSAISREHVRFLLTSNGVRVRDEDSKNGTFLGGTRVHDVTLTTNAALTLGETTLAVSIATDALELPLSASTRCGEAIGTSSIMRNLFARIEQVAGSDLTILLEGESGVGKDVLARAIHAKSHRSEGPFVVADCSAIAANLIESELFGHERGAFTGADRARQGVVEEANGGTLFLDEIGELPVEMQPKLLRMMEQREVRPVGTNRARPVDVRIVAATNRRLAEAARTGEFRSDLFFRLAVVRLLVPPLRDRPEDVLPIALSMLRAAKGDDRADLAPDFASMLAAYTWPGNVRELRNVMDRYAVFGAGGSELFDGGGGAAAAERPHPALTMTYQEARRIALDRFDEDYLPRLLEHAGGAVAVAAERAGVNKSSFYRMLERIRRGKGR
jgi:transcriptional regulator with PAS, ATPase and Fis domain